ncbi:MAG: hypothetical protein ACREXX_13295 [Gammaproteobacteria bacterium]
MTATAMAFRPGDRVRVRFSPRWSGRIEQVEHGLAAAIVARRGRRATDDPDFRCVRLEFLDLVPGQMEAMLA